jgi:glutamyl-tRNA reductase
MDSSQDRTPVFGGVTRGGPDAAQPSQPPHAPRLPGHDPALSIYAEGDTDLVLPGRKLVIVGYTHHTAPLAVRSQFAVVKRDLPALARRFKALPNVYGCVVLATCNRLEACLEIRSEAEAEAAFVDLLGRHDLDARAMLARCLMVHIGEAAVSHLFRVASGLDSMVLGDAQILGQTKEAYRMACHHGTASPMLHKVFHAAFRCAKAVLTDTDLGAGAQSVAGAALSLLARKIGGLQAKDYLLIGVNEMTEMAGRRLLKAEAARLTLCNRTASKAVQLGKDLGAELVPWAQRLETVSRVDAVVTCTASSEPIFTRRELANLAAARPERQLAVVDIAVPPDVEPLAEMESATASATTGGAGPTRSSPETSMGTLTIIDLEDVAAYQQEVEQRRCQATAGGETIVTAQVAAFGAWLQRQALGPKMERLRLAAEESLSRELERLSASVPAGELEAMASFGRTLIKRFLGAYRRTEDQF